jgi:hypothetical protein
MAAIRKGEFAQRVGVSAARVSQWVRAGMPVEPDGTLDLQRALAWVTENVDRSGGGWPARKAAPQGATPTAAAPHVGGEQTAAAPHGATPTAAAIDPQRALLFARAKKLLAEARRAEREERRHAGELIEVAKVSEYVAFISQIMRDGILTQADRLAAAVAAVGGDIGEVHRIIRADGRALLERWGKTIAAGGYSV